MEEQEDNELAESEDMETTDVSSPEGGEVEESEEEAEPTKRRKWMRSALLVLRDVGIALLVVFLVFVALWAYSGVWPPIVVVESSSMQHDDFSSSVGVIDTGDLVIVQTTNSHKEVEAYVHGECSGHSTYGDSGDVIIYNEGGGGDKPIIHRALIYLKFNTTTNNSFDVPGLECDYWEYGVNWWLLSAPTTEPRNLTTPLTIRLSSAHRNFNVTLNLGTLLNAIKTDDDWNDGGFIAMGDNNDHPDNSLIKHDWIIGKARGELPWFGLIKLSVSRDIPWGTVCSAPGERGCAADNAWTSLIIALVVLIAVPIALDVILGFYQRHKQNKGLVEQARKEEEEASEEDEEETEEEVEEEPSEEEPEEGIDDSPQAE
ncbi:MAG: S26 family signal peptidase [Thermoplasmata archaeon]|nr:S26 family signal peptidase [Thermoplasmata archaeon]